MFVAQEVFRVSPKSEKRELSGLEKKMPLSLATEQPIGSEPNTLRALPEGRRWAQSRAAALAAPAIAKTPLQLVRDGFLPPEPQNDNPIVPIMPPATEPKAAGEV